MLSFDYAPALLKGIIDQELKRYVVGCSPDEIRAVYEQNLQATEYIGREGLAMWGTAAIDVALWDLLARRLEVPASLLFGRRFSAVPVYGSGGWISYSDEELADEVCRYIARGFGGVKIKIGGPQEDRDIERIRAVRRALGPDRKLMVDANQGLTLEYVRFAWSGGWKIVIWTGLKNLSPRAIWKAIRAWRRRPKFPWRPVSANSE